MSGAPTRRALTSRAVVALRGDRRLVLPDDVVTEEPLQIRVAWGGPPEAVSVTMRTPGHDFDLAVGFLLSEGLVGDPEWVRSVVYCTPEAVPEQDYPGQDYPGQDYNVVTVHLDRRLDLGPRRLVPVSAACGVCGTATVDQLAARCPVVTPSDPFPAAALLGLPDELRSRQTVFDRTGGLHAAGLFDREGRALAVREDIGRHNAVDKIVGWAALQQRLPLVDSALVVSGRVSFEIVQKAAVAGIPVVVAVSAASSMAVETAERLGVCLIGFARGDRANIYAHAERVTG